MPCLAIHLAVAKKYLEKHPEENKEEFILGSIAPDIDLPNIENYMKVIKDINNKNNRHFGENYRTNNFIEYMKRKVNFNKFFSINDINTSFLRAYFLHLICDYYFFGKYIKDDIFKNMSLDEAIKVGYNEYNIITPILIKKYNLEIPKEIKDLISEKGIGNLKILNESTIDKFIEEMSSTDLESEKKQLVIEKNKFESWR